MAEYQRYLMEEAVDLLAVVTLAELLTEPCWS